MARQTASAQAVEDSLVRAGEAQELIIGYQELLRYYQSLVAKPRDSTRAGAAESKKREGEDEQVPGDVPRQEIDGLVVDETQTKIGRDFYDVFYARWNPPEGAVNYTVRVQEQPLPNLGTRISVRVNDEVAFQGMLQPRYDFIESAAQQAIFYTARMLSIDRPAGLFGTPQAY